jgi:DNA ligase-1
MKMLVNLSPIKLYARNSNKDILEWSGEVVIINETPTIIISTGIFNSKKTAFNIPVIEGKNIGKINETTPFEQAVRDLEGRVLKLKRKGYKELKDLPEYNEKESYLTLKDFLDVCLPENNTDIDGYEKPMKAQPYIKGNGEICIKFPCLGQPKINGFRCTGRYITEEQNDMFNTVLCDVEFKSKNGLTYNCLKHIAHDLLKIKADEEVNKALQAMYGLNIDDIIFDGEMYIENTPLEDISSAVRKANNNTPKLKYVIFDLAIKDFIQADRLKILKLIFDTFLLRGNTLTSVIKIDTKVVHTDNVAQLLTDEWISKGFEGGIFRSPNALYEFGKRPQTMVKLKRTITDEFLILDIIGSKLKPELAVFICKNDLNDEQFKVNPEGTHEQKAAYLENKEEHIGKYLTVEYRERTGKKQIPFHAVGITIRDYE